MSGLLPVAVPVALSLAVLASALLALGAAFAPAGRDGDEIWTLALAEVAPHPALDLPPLPGADEIECTRCHTEIAAEWATTQHAHAWVDAEFQAQIKEKRRPESCTGCHVPRPMLAGDPERFGQKPLPRADAVEARAHGITCRSCHEGADGAMHGPFPAAGAGAVNTSAHASVRDERFVAGGSDALCTACHRTTVGPVIGIAKDYELARLGERGASCVGCHMRPIERPIATEPDAPDSYPVRAGRSHRLQTPRDPGFLAAAFELTAHRDGGSVALRVKNRAGHRVPGLIDRRIVFRVEALDAAGAPMKPAASTEHTIDSTAYLPLAGSLDVRLAAPAAALRVIGEHHAPGHAEAIPFLEQTLAVP